MLCFCHTHIYLEISACMKIWKVSTHMIGPQSGTIIWIVTRPPTHPSHHRSLKFVLISLKILEMKTTYNVRQPQNIKSWISQQPLFGSSSNFKLNLRGPYQNQKFLKLRGHPMEDDLKILKIKYISNRWSDFIQILKLS